MIFRCFKRLSATLMAAAVLISPAVRADDAGVAAATARSSPGWMTCTASA